MPPLDSPNARASLELRRMSDYFGGASRDVHQWWGGEVPPERRSVLEEGWDAFVFGLTEQNPEMAGSGVKALGIALENETIFDAGFAFDDVKEEIGAGQPQSVQSFADVGSLGDAMRYLSGTLGQGLSSIAPVLAGLGIGGGAGLAVAGPPGAAVGSVTGAGSAGYLLNAGETFDKLRGEGVDDVQAAEWAVGLAFPQAALDVMGAKFALAGFKDAAAKGLAGHIAKRAGQGAVVEGATEAAQETTREVAGAFLTGEPKALERAESVVNAAIGGALVGGTLGGAGGAADGLRARTTETPDLSTGTGEKTADTGQMSTGGPQSEPGGPTGAPAIAPEPAPLEGEVLPPERAMQPRAPDPEADPTVIYQDRRTGVGQQDSGALVGRVAGGGFQTEKSAAASGRARGLADHTPVERDGAWYLAPPPARLAAPVEDEARAIRLPGPPEETEAIALPGPEPVSDEPLPPSAIGDYRLPEGWSMHRRSDGKFVAENAQWRLKPKDTADEAVQAANEAAQNRARLDAAYAQAETEGLAGPARTRRVMQIMEGADEAPQGEAADASPAAATELERAENPAVAQAAPAGEKREVLTPSGRRVEVQPVVVEAADLTASHTDEGAVNPAFPQDLQPRDRSRVASQTQIASMAQSLEPALLMPAAQASEGAPVVGPDGIVESGNARTLAVMQAYRQRPESAARYRTALAEAGYDVEGMTAPVLVQRRETGMTTEERQAFTREANQRTTAERGASELAAADAAAMSGQVLDAYRGGAVKAVDNRDFVQRFIGAIPESERPSMMTADGSLSQAGVQRIENAMFARAYEDADLLASLREDLDGKVKGIGNAMIETAPAWSQMRAAAEAGTIDPEMDTTPQLVEAVRMVDRARSGRETLAQLVNQRDVFTGEIDPRTEGFLRLMFRNRDNWTGQKSAEKIAQGLRAYAEEAEKTSPDAGMFGDTVTPDQVLDAALGKQEEVERRAARQAAELGLDQPKPAPAPAAPAPELVGKKDGSPFATEKSARMAMTMRKLPDHQPIQDARGWWLMPPAMVDESPQPAADADQAAAKPSVQFARGQRPPPGRMSAKQIADAVNPITRQWDAAVTPRVLAVDPDATLPGDLPADVRDEGARLMALQAENPGSMKGAYIQSSDPSQRPVVFLFSDGIASAREARQVLAHEVVGHASLQAMLGPRFNETIDQVLRLAESEPRVRRIADEVRETYGRPPDSVVAAEILARMAETTFQPVRRLVRYVEAAVRRFLRGLGINVRMGYVDLMDMIAEAERRLHAGPGPAPDAQAQEERQYRTDLVAAVNEGPRVQLSRRGNGYRDPRGDFRPIDRMLRLLAGPLGRQNERGEWIGAPQTKAETARIIREAKLPPALESFQPYLEAARAAWLDRHGVPMELQDRQRRAEGHRARIMDQLADVVAPVIEADLTDAQSQALQEILEGNEATDARLARLAQPVRDAIDALGKEAVEIGLLNEATWRKNLGGYLHRSYAQYEADAPGIVKWGRKMRRRGMSGSRGIAGDTFKRRGIRYKVKGGMQRLLQNVPEDMRAAAAEEKNWRVLTRIDPESGRAKGVVFWPASLPLPDGQWQGAEWQDRGVFHPETYQGDFVLRRDFTEAERREMGEVRDARFNIIRTFEHLARDLPRGAMFRDIAANPDWFQAEKPQGVPVVDAAEVRAAGVMLDTETWVKVPDQAIPKSALKRWGALAGGYLRAPIWRDLSQMDALQDRNMWNYILRQWKKNKALALDTPIPTPAGWTTMGEIKVGDTVFDEKGQPCTVEAVKDVQHGRPCYEVAFSDRTTIVADDEHWWFVVGRNNPDGKVLTTAEIRETLTYPGRGDRNHSVPVAHALELPDAALPLPPYALGLWLGDGHAGSSRLTVGADAVGEIDDLLRAAGVFSGTKGRDKRSSAVTFTIDIQPVRRNNRPNAFKEALKGLGVLGNKAIPPIYLRGSVDQRLALLRGLLDSDGWCVTSGQCGFATSTPALRDGMTELLRSLGYKPMIMDFKSASGKPAWRILFHAYADTPVFGLKAKLERQRQRPARRQRSATRQIVGVTKVESVPVRCIAVSSSSRLYLAGDGMVPTHNTARTPSVHMNNVMSNVFMSYLMDLSPRQIQRGIREYIDKGPLYQEYRDEGGFGSSWAANELDRANVRKILRTALDEYKADNRYSASLFKLWDFWRFIDDRMTNLYQAEDEVFRMASYIRDREGLGMSQPEAARRAVHDFLNYDIRAPLPNWLRRNALPFLSYTYRAVPVVAGHIVSRPWKMAGFVAAGYGFIHVVEALMGDDAEELILTERERGLTWTTVPINVPLPFYAPDGGLAMVNMSRWIPGATFLDTDANPSGFIPESAFISGPLMLAFEIALNKGAFVGTELHDESDSTMQAAGKIAGHLYRSIMPGYAPGNWASLSMWRAVTGQEDSFGIPYDPAFSAARAVGIKVWSYLPARQRQRVLREIEATNRAFSKARGRIVRRRQRKALTMKEARSELLDLEARRRARIGRLQGALQGKR